MRDIFTKFKVSGLEFTDDLPQIDDMSTATLSKAINGEPS